MTSDPVRSIADAVLYEGYMLYPYRRSVKNRQRWTFGGLFPQAVSEAHGGSEKWFQQTQCLLIGDAAAVLNIRVRFLHVLQRTAGELLHAADATNDGDPQYRAVDVLRVGERQYPTWQEAAEREVPLEGLRLARLVQATHREEFQLAGERSVETVHDDHGAAAGVLVREHQAISMQAEVAAERLEDGLFRITLTVRNRTPAPAGASVPRDEAAMQALVSTHALLEVSTGEFVSLTDPPELLQDAARDCSNLGVWPVLVGDPDQRNQLLASPIILYDYPQIACESPGDLFDGTEIDEILTLRIMTLTDEERAEAASIDERTAAMLQRSQSLAREQLMSLHGTFRGLTPATRGAQT
jgi:hypothetical protein